MATLTKKQKKVRNRIAAAAALLILFKLLPLSGWLQAVCFLIPYFIIGYDVLRKAFMGIANGQVFDENFLMAIATVGAFATGEFDEAVFVMLFYQTGELFQDYAVGKSRASITALMDIRPDTANLETENGLEEVDPEDVTVGSVIVVKPGERVPLDGTVLEGSSTLDTAALTGEALPRTIHAGDEIISGCVNLTGLLRVTVTKPCEESTVSKILEPVSYTHLRTKVIIPKAVLLLFGSVGSVSPAVSTVFLIHFFEGLSDFWSGLLALPLPLDCFVSCPDSLCLRFQRIAKFVLCFADILLSPICCDGIAERPILICQLINACVIKFSHSVPPKSGYLSGTFLKSLALDFAIIRSGTGGESIEFPAFPHRTRSGLPVGETDGPG